MVKPLNLVMTGLTLIVAAIACFYSFHGYAGFLTSDLDSDQAIHILMTADLQLPADLYYWGQQRGGSIAPILAHWLMQQTWLMPQFSPIEALSVVQYGILGLGYLGFAFIFNSNMARLLFAIAWFLPPRSFGFLIMLAHPYAPQLAFLGVAIALLKNLPRPESAIRIMLRHLMITTAVACLFISFWASDFSVISMALLLGFAALGLIYRVWKVPKTLFSPKFFSIPLLLALLVLEIINMVITSSYGMQFIRYAKAHAAAQEPLLGTNQIEQVKVLFHLFTQPLIQAIQATLRGQIKVPSEVEIVSGQAVQALQNILIVSSFVFWCCALAFTAIYSLLFLSKIWLRKATLTEQFKLSPWIGFFLMNAIVGSAAILASQWVYINSIEDGSGKRYFVPIYIFCWVAALLVTEGLPGITRKPLWLILIVVAASGSATLPGTVYGFEKFSPTIQRLQPLQTLGTAGIIGNHWSSYLLCSVDPHLLSCTQFDEYGHFYCPDPAVPPERRYSGRCWRCVDRVMTAPKIYLVKQRWLESFPDQTEQFGECLVRVSDPFELAGYTLAQYQRRVAP